MFTGALADVKLSIGRLAEDLGIGGENLTEKVSNTQGFILLEEVRLFWTTLKLLVREVQCQIPTENT